MKQVWNEKRELLSREEIEKIRLRRLRKQLKYCYGRSEFYKQKFDDIGFQPEDIKTWADFRKIPPLMDKEEERQSQKESLERFNHPFGMHLCCPPEKIIITKTTGGTTGMPTFTYSFTQHDFDRWNEGTARVFWLAGIRPADRVLFCFPLSGGWAGGIVKTPLQYMGILCLDLGAETPVEKIVEYANITRPNVLMSTPSFAEGFIEAYPRSTGKPVSAIGIKKLLLSGEPGVAIPSIRKRMEEAFGGKWNDYLMINSEGFSGSCLAEEYNGLHEVALDLSIWVEDLIDLDTHQPIEVKNGAIGEGLLTSLDREGLPLIKYRLGDVIQVFTHPCECGYPGPGYRIKHLGRLSDRLFVEGASVFPIAVRDVITSFIPRVTGAMRIVLTEPPPNITPPLKIKVEYGVGIQPNQLPELAREIEEQMLKVYRVRSKVEFVLHEALGRVTKKTPMFEECYPS
ncbi:MAG: phenylacetate--CoA ligase [Deltaproteobacteria bacterium]|nr:phenylacetate--CoA ligase [Deltaproteobacteria bacterium]